MEDPLAILTTFGLLAILSLPACVYAGFLRMDRGCFVPYERRWPAPWGAVGGVLALSLVLLSVLDFFTPKPPADKVAAALSDFSATEFIQNSLFETFALLAFVVMVGLFLRSSTRATLSDLGIGQSKRQWRTDIATGVVAALAALLPVYAVNALVVFVLKAPPEHPTLMRLMTDPNPLVLLATLLTAGVAAPVFEEFIFRLLLQGWLERVEDESLALSGKMPFEGAEEDGKQPRAEEPEDPVAESGVLEGALPDPDDPFASPQGKAVLRMRRRQGRPPSPPAESFAGMPHGLAPILISSFLFAVVHVGQGAAPIPLFVFALVLGYLYQRTHRLAPSIAAHMTFNVLSLLLTWAQAG